MLDESLPQRTNIDARRLHRATVDQLITRDKVKKLKLSPKTSIRVWDELTAEIERQLGGRDRLSAIERSLVQAYVAATLTLHTIKARVERRGELDFPAVVLCGNLLMKLSGRLGLKRQPCEIETPSLSQYLSEVVGQQEGAE